VSGSAALAQTAVSEAEQSLAVAATVVDWAAVSEAVELICCAVAWSSVAAAETCDRRHRTPGDGAADELHRLRDGRPIHHRRGDRQPSRQQCTSRALCSASDTAVWARAAEPDTWRPIS
jgi:hypothetical protein